MASFLKKMLSATGLTRRGSLIDASAAIQRALKPLATPPPPQHAGGPAPAPAPAPATASAPAPAASHPADPGIASAGDKRAHASRGHFTARSFTGAAGTRGYKLFEPSGFDGETLPLVVMLHGCTQNADDFAAGTRMNALAQQRGLLVLYPEQAPRSNANKCWNWFVPGDQRRGAGEPSLIAGMTRHVMQTHPVDPSRVYVAGLSAGAAMAAILAREYPDLFAAAGIHSGLAAGAAHDVASAFSAMKTGTAAAPAAWTASLAQASQRRPGLAAWPSVMPLPATAPATAPPAPAESAGSQAQAEAGAPLIVFHGDADTTVNALNGAHAVEAALGAEQAWTSERQDTARTESGQAAHRAFTRTVYRLEGAARTAPSRAEHWVVHGGGHAWSGGAAAGSYTEHAGPDASLEMLRFFAEHPLRAAAARQQAVV